MFRNLSGKVHYMMSSIYLGPTLLLVACYTMIQSLAFTGAAPMNHKKTIGGCPQEIRKSLVRAKNCAELYKCGQRISGVYNIDPDGKGAFHVYCDQTTADGGWTVFQKRLNGNVDFNRTWDDYKHGFGDFLIGEFWLGLNNIYRLTQNKTGNRLRVDLRATFNTQPVHAEYSWVGIGHENTTYQLNLGNFSKNSTANRDSFIGHRGTPFSTRDKSACDSQKLTGGWWFNKNCAVSSNLNGVYREVLSGRIRWGFLILDNATHTAPLTSEMKIRPISSP